VHRRDRLGAGMFVTLPSRDLEMSAVVSSHDWCYPIRRVR
jgi:hypothetical protein